MTFGQLLVVLARRWYVGCVVLAITSLAIVLALGVRGVYTTEANVVFLPPGNTLEQQAESMVHFAAAVQRIYDQGEIADRVSSSAATLYGQGIRSGSSVELHDSGGQWGTNFNSPILTIEVVDPSPKKVQTEMTAILAKINDISTQLQSEQGVAPGSYIGWQLSPSAPTVSYVDGSRVRAVGGIAGVGLGSAVAACVITDRALARRRRRRRSREPAGPAQKAAVTV